MLGKKGIGCRIASIFFLPTPRDGQSASIFEVGGGLARQVYQLLNEDADVRPLEGRRCCWDFVSCGTACLGREGNMYMEAALLGEMLVNDTKALPAEPRNFTVSIGLQRPLS